MKYCAINGKQQSSISVTDRGFFYGDGSFTTAKIVNGEIELLDAHINRLLTACQYLEITCPSEPQLKQQLITVAKKHSLAVLKVIITAGNGGKGYARDESASENIVIIVDDFPLHYQQWQQTGLTLGISKHKMGLNPLLAGFKHLNRLEQVLFKNELAQRKEDDLLITNLNNHLIEATSSNVFWLQNKQWHTADLSLSGVAGLMRDKILALLETKIVQTPVDNLEQVDAMFLCNTLMGIIPVKQLNMPIGTRKLSIECVTQLQNMYKNNKAGS